MLTSTTVSPVCSKCGTMKKSGKPSCCARGGAWFKNCGDAGDPKFDYTWTEGIHACKSMLLSDRTLRCVFCVYRAIDADFPAVYNAWCCGHLPTIACSIGINAAYIMLIPAFTQQHPRRRGYPPQAATSVPSAPPTRLVNIVVALEVVLGSRTAEMSATPNLIIHGPRASSLAKVSKVQLWSEHRQKIFSVMSKALFIR